MANDREEELKRLDEELTADAHIDTVSPEAAPAQDIPPKKQEDIWVILLMILASFLCLGIIGFLIYWLQFLVG